MRALTVRQPWAWAIIHGGKDVENRSRNLAGSYRGPVAIHAAKADDRDAWAALAKTDLATWGRAMDARESLLPGVILGVVDLVDVHHADDCWDWNPNTAMDDLCSPWAQPGHHHLALANPRPLARPIPWRGQLGLWTLPDDVLTDPEPGEQPWCELPRCPRRADPGSVLCTEHQVGAGRRP